MVSAMVLMRSASMGQLRVGGKTVDYSRSGRPLQTGGLSGAGGGAKRKRGPRPRRVPGGEVQPLTTVAIASATGSMLPEFRAARQIRPVETA